MGDQPLPAPVLGWVRAETGAAEIHVVGPIPGSSTGELVALDLSGPGRPVAAVLRRYTKPVILARHPDLAGAEAVVLSALPGTGLPVPRLLAVDADGAATGIPSLLMTRLAGAPVLRPPAGSRASWMESLAVTAAGIHAAAVPSLPPVEPWFEPELFAVPGWAREPAAWRRCFAELAAPMPVASTVLVHRDLHPGNVLWADGEVTGVVDWVNAGVGPAAADLARCRTNLTILDGMDAATAFLARYRSHAGVAGDDQRWWDLADLAALVKPVPGASMLDGMRTVLDLGILASETDLHHRLEAHLVSVLDAG